MRREKRYNSDYYSRVYVNNYNYNNTSEAYELYTDYDDYTQSRRKKAQKVKQLEKSTETMPLGTLKVMVCVVIAFSMAIGFVSVTAGNNARHREIINMREQLEALNENNAYLETRLNETIDLKRIEEIAQTRLGMSKPKSYQIKYIDVQKESYTMQYKTENQDKLTFAQVVGNLFKD